MTNSPKILILEYVRDLGFFSPDVDKGEAKQLNKFKHGALETLTKDTKIQECNISFDDGRYINVRIAYKLPNTRATSKVVARTTSSLEEISKNYPLNGSLKQAFFLEHTSLIPRDLYVKKIEADVIKRLLKGSKK